MALSIKDRIYLQISINGVELPLDQNTISYLHIVESVRIYLPMLSFQINDITKFLTLNTLLVDGAPIQVTIEIEKYRMVYNFRLFSSKEFIANGATSYAVKAYLDVPVYWTASAVTPIRGSASAVLKEIAAKTGLTYDGVTTNESQIWMPMNMKYCEWAKDVVDSASTSDKSCIKLCVTVDKVMKTVDISKFTTMPVRQSFSNTDKSKSLYLISDYEVLNKSGFFNASTGYKDAKIVQSFLKPDNTINAITFTKTSKSIMVNSKIKDAVSQNRVAYAPIDIGNVSPTYEQAQYQNRRLSNYFSFGLNFITNRPVKAQLLDLVSVDISKPELDGVIQYSGNYLLTSKVTYIQGMNFFHKCEIYRQGLNASNTANQL